MIRPHQETNHRSLPRLHQLRPILIRNRRRHLPHKFRRGQDLIPGPSLRDDHGVEGAGTEEEEGGQEGDVTGEGEEEETLQGGAHGEPGGDGEVGEKDLG